MSITGIKGMNDILPGEVETWQFLEAAARRVFSLHGFSEIRVPVVERTELFCRSIGETTDIVEKEMYTFQDKGGNSLTLRPEGTASVMRALIEHKLYARDPLNKLFYLGPMFRHERPQKGRYRQFYQIGVEAVGVDDPSIDAQTLAMLNHFADEIGLRDLDLQLNSLGCPVCRPDYREQLLTFLQKRLDGLCDDCRRRYQTNPLRVLDCKVAGCREATLEAPAMLDYLCNDCDDHFSTVRGYLDGLGTPYSVNKRMVRGLDYYTKTTFELVTGQLGAQNAVAAGGRYDGLVKQLGGPELPGIGFAMGVERLFLLLDGSRCEAKKPDVFLAALGEKARREVFNRMHQLQRRGIRAEMEYQAKSLKAQMRRADKLGARFVLILGEDELTRGVAQLRDMADSSQREIELARLEEFFEPSPVIAAN